MRGSKPDKPAKLAALAATCSCAVLAAAAAEAQTGQQSAQMPEKAMTKTEPIELRMEGLEPGYTIHTYMPIVIDKDFESLMEEDVQERPEVLERQRNLLEERYDLSDRPSDVMMSAGRRAVQEGVRVKLPDGTTWDDLATMSSDEIREKGLFPKGFLPLPHVKHATGGMVFPQMQIDVIREAENRSLDRFDVEFDLPEHLLPEFPPPLYLTTHPTWATSPRDRCYIVTPVQLEGMRLLLTQFPQQQFNATEDRKVEKPSNGVTCLDCHVNGHTNGTFHLNPDTRPQAARFRIETVSLRGMFNQQIHGSKRSLRSVEDFTEFEQRTAYFDGDQVIAAKKGANVLDRGGQVDLMAQMQNLFDFPPTPKLDTFGRLDPAKATEQELKGEELFMGKARCVECHAPPHYMDNLMHDLKVERFYEPQMIAGQYIKAEGPIKTFTLRGIKDSPPYMHDGRLLTLEDTVEFFNLIQNLQLTQDEKDALVAFMRTL